MRPEGDVDWSGLLLPRAGLRCVIVIPARNESLLLPRALAAIAAQRGVSFGHEVIVLANNCNDDTAAVARQVARTCRSCPIHVVEAQWPTAIANVGRARQALMEVASARVTDSHASRGMIVSTDADTCVADDWLARTACAIDAGVDAVGGRIVPTVDAALPAAAWHLMRLDDLYRSWRERLQCLIDPDPADPWPRHHQHFGASLAVTARAYRAVGGLPLVPFLEDEALVRELRLDDRSIRHAPDVRVRTSARLDGRAEVGLSWQLREWSRQLPDGLGPRVIDPVIEADRWALRRGLRTLWRDARRQSPAATATAESVEQAADALQIDPEWLTARLGSTRTFGRLWEDIELVRKTAPSFGQDRLVPMEDALHALRQLVRAQRFRSVG